MLKPRKLDIVITKITPKTITYKLTANHQMEEWRIPAESTFDTSGLEVGRRYLVETKVIMSMVWDYKAQNRVPKERYDWFSVRTQQEKARLGAMTSKQSKASKELAEMQIVGEGDLFQF